MHHVTTEPPMAHSLKIGLILNEPPIAEKSAAARSYEATTRVIARELENKAGSTDNIEFPAFWMNSSDINADEKLCQAKFPSLASRFHLFDIHTPRRFFEKINNRLQPMAFHASPAMRAAIKKALDSQLVDLLHLEHAWMVYALPRSFNPDRVLLSLHFLLSTDFTAAPPARSFREIVTRQRLIRAELRLIRRCTHFRVLSDDMAETLKKLHPSAKIHVVPLAIDASAYEFRPRPATHNLQAPVLSVIGSMNWPPTQSAANRMLTLLWPSIYKAMPHARLQVVGRQARQFFGEYHGRDNIEIHENVPRIEPYFHGSSLLVYAPSAGSGMKVKVQEAMLMGLPVITNRSGIEGLNADHDRHCLIAETDSEFISQTINLLNNPSLAQTISTKARALVESQCDPQMIYHKTLDIYQNMAR